MSHVNLMLLELNTEGVFRELFSLLLFLAIVQICFKDISARRFQIISIILYFQEFKVSCINYYFLNLIKFKGITM